MKAALLPERGVVKVVGEDARKFLNGLLTADIEKVTPAHPAFAALLTPQGKIMVDMIVAENPAEDGGGFFLDAPRALAPMLVQRLNFYKLRAKVIAEDLSDMLGVMAIWDGAAASDFGLSYADPRLSALGSREMDGRSARIVVAVCRPTPGIDPNSARSAASASAAPISASAAARSRSASFSNSLMVRRID